MIDACGDLARLDDLVAGRLDARDADDAGRHVAACEDCALLVASLRSEAAALAVLQRQGPRTTRPEVPGHRIDRLLHEGGQGEVWLGTQESTGRAVAVKVLRGGTASDTRGRRRFELEIDVAAALDHPNIVTAFDRGETSDGRDFLAMQYVDGETLDAYRRARSLPIDATLRLFDKIAAAVEYSHQRGVIHRDLKPGNVIVNARGEPALVDFGLAKALEPQTWKVDSLRTLQGEFLGTLAYAAPEQLRGDPDAIDARTDVYALGVLLYEMLAGELPYPVEGSLASVARAVEEHEPEPLSVRHPRIDRDLEAIVLQALAKDPDERYQSVGEMRRDLVRRGAGLPVEARPRSGWYVLRKAVQRNRLAFVAGAAVAVTLLAATFVSAMFWLRSVRDAETARLRAHAARIAAAHAAILADEVSLARRHLEAVPSSERAFEWQLLAMQLDDSERIIVPEAGAPWSVEFAPEGGSLLVGTIGTIARYSLADGALLAVVDTPNATFGLAPDPTGSVVVAGHSDGEVTVRDAETLALRGRFRPSNSRIDHVEMSPDGESVAVCSWDRDVTIHSLTAPAAPVTTLKGHTAPSTGVAFSPDGTQLATIGLDNALRVWDRPTGDQLAVVQVHPDTAEWRMPHSLSVTWSPDGALLALGLQDGGVELRHPDGRLETRLLGHRDRVRSVSFAPDGSWLASASEDNTVRIWDLTTRRCRSVLRGHSNTVFWVAVSPDGSWLATASKDGTVRLWRSWPHESTRRYPGHRNVGLLAMTTTRDGSVLATGGVDGSIKLREARTGILLRELDGHRHRIGRSGLAFDPAGRLLASAAPNGNVMLWDVATGKSRGGIRTPSDGCEALTFVAADVVVHGDRAGRVHATKIAHHQDHREIWCSAAQDGKILDLAFDPVHGRLAFATANGELGHLDPAGGELLRRRRAFADPIRCIAFDRTGELIATGHSDGTARVFGAADLEPRIELACHEDLVTDIAFDEDSRRVLTLSFDRDLRVWDVDSGQLLLVFQAHDDRPLALTVQPDGTTVFTAGKNVRVWETRPPAPDVLHERIARVVAASIDPDDEPMIADRIAQVTARTDLTPAIRQRAIERLQRLEDDAAHLNWHAFDVVKFSGASATEVARALRWAERAAELRPDSPAIRNTLGVAQYRAGRLEAALTSLRRAERERGQPEPSDAAYLAMTLHELDRDAAAQRELERLRAMLIGPDLRVEAEWRTLLAEAEALLRGNARKAGNR